MCENHNIAKPQVVQLEGMHRRDIVKRLWAGTMVLGVAGGATGCASAAKFFAPSDEQLVPLAAEAWEQTKKETPISKDPAANARLQAIGETQAAVCMAHPVVRRRCRSRCAARPSFASRYARAQRARRPGRSTSGIPAREPRACNSPAW